MSRPLRIEYPDAFYHITARGGYAAYKYDVKGRRIEKDVNGEITRYIYDGDQLLAEYDASGNLKRNYFYGAGDINPSMLVENGTVYYFHHDHLNTPRKITDENGDVVWEATYKSFGQPDVTTETVTNNIRLPGQYYDAESGFHYNNQRYYDPETGRYLRADPIGIEGGINLYNYVENNPVNLIDPTGEVKCMYSISLMKLVCVTQITCPPKVVECFAVSGDNNPYHTCKEFVGPIPAGPWKIGISFKKNNDSRNKRANLSPLPGNTGYKCRSGGFEIHWWDPKRKGCIAIYLTSCLHSLMNILDEEGGGILDVVH